MGYTFVRTLGGAVLPGRAATVAKQDAFEESVAPSALQALLQYGFA